MHKIGRQGEGVDPRRGALDALFDGTYVRLSF